MELFQREDEFSSGVYSRQQVGLVRGKGVRVWDEEGNSYLDCAGGIGVANVGHANEEVARAICEQAGTLSVCPTAYFYNEKRAKLVQKLARIAPGGLKRSFLCNSGTEAIEASIKFARACREKGEIVAAMRAFHGRTLGSLSATWNKKYRKPFRPLAGGFTHVPYGDSEKLEEAVTADTAAVLLEPIQGEGGVYPAPDGYLAEARQICDRTGALLILDEVQTGFGRTGEMFACQHWGVTPDLMAVAKAMGGGFPIGAALMREDIRPDKGTHGSTFGGNPLAASAALATINYIEDNELVDLARKRGNYFKEGLQGLGEKYPKKVRAVRGLGLMLALQLRGRSASYLNGLMEKGILALPAGSTVVRFLPPLEISENDVEEVVRSMDELLAS